MVGEVTERGYLAGSVRRRPIWAESCIAGRNLSLTERQEEHLWQREEKVQRPPFGTELGG